MASSLSDIDTKSFQERTKPSVKAADNPFVKQTVSASDLLVEDLRLTGIVYRPDESYALISGYMLKEGENIAGFKVKLIEKDHVVLRQMDVTKVLRLE
jgi:hypothetical protein